MRRSFIYFTTLSLFLILFDQTFGLLFAHNFAQKLTEPLEIGLYQTVSIVVEATRFVASLPSTFRENRRLYEEEVKLVKMRAKLIQIEEENKVLREQLGVELTKDFKLLPARILGSRIEEEIEYWVLEVGAKDGVKNDQAVIFKDVLLGKIERVGDSQSLVLPIFSSSSKIPAQVVHPGSRISGLVTGELGSKLQLTQVLQTEDLEINDTVVSSGASGVFPAGLLIGKVIEILQEDVQIFKSAELKPFWDVKDLTTVFVVLE